MKFCVIGAGNGGRAFAAYLSSKEHPVNLYNRSLSRIIDIKRKGKIKSKGEIKGSFKLNIITQRLKHAVKHADVILVVTPASAHKDIAQKIAPHLTKDQIILLNPGRTFGAIEFSQTIKKEIGCIPVFIAETQTLLFTSRRLKKNRVQILKIKDSVQFSAYPEKYTFFVYDTLHEIFPQLVPADDYLEMTLKNVGMLLHPTLSVLNSGMMDIGKEFKFYSEGATKRTCEVLERLQMEINQIMNLLCLKQYNFCKWAQKSYGVTGKCIHDAIQEILAYRDINAPKKLITRYFTEDIPTGLVPISSLAALLGIKTPIINSIINLSSVLCGMDFKSIGRTVKALNIEEYIKRRITTEELISLGSEQQISIN
jgi:opine dehydrogenase